MARRRTRERSGRGGEGEKTVRPERPGLPDCWLFHLGQTAYLCIPVSPSGRSCPARLQRLAVSQSLRLKPRSRRIFREHDARSRQVPRFPSRFTGSKWMIVLGPVWCRWALFVGRSPRRMEESAHPRRSLRAPQGTGIGVYPVDFNVVSSRPARGTIQKSRVMHARGTNS
jgi:hypothetical protein